MKTMRELLAVILVLAALAMASSVPAQTPQTLQVVVPLSPANEVPPISGLNASASATITITPTLDSQGVITGGSLILLANLFFDGGVTITGAHFHQAPAGVNGPVVIPMPISPTGAPVTLPSFSNFLFTSSNVSLSLLTSLITNPEGFYINFHTSTHPSGALRGQLATFAAGEPAGALCQTYCFRSAQFFSLHLFNLPRGTVIVGGVNNTSPISTAFAINRFQIAWGLSGGTSALARLNRGYVAVQLSLLPDTGADIGKLNSSLRCHGLAFNPIVLSNGALLTTSSSLNLLLAQARFAIRENRAADMLVLAGLFDQLDGNSTFGACQ